MKRAVLLSACLALVACEAPSSSPPVPPPQGPLQPDAAARVGDVVISRDQIARIVAAQRIAPPVARDLAVRDALFAAEARSRGLAGSPDIELAAHGVLARALVKEIAAAAEARGPVTDAELDEVTARHWTDLDRPDAARTVHVIVVVKKDAPPDVREQASSLAAKLREAVSPAADLARTSAAPAAAAAPDPAVDAFRNAARAVPSRGMDVRVEPLAPVVEDGRIVGQSGRFDPVFSRAALALSRRGDLSPVVESAFGFHVLLLLDRIPGRTFPREERRRMVREEVMRDRARADHDALLAGLRTTAAIHRDVDAVLALTPVDQ
ncbi:MAG: peptidyl-prolyl cis-trans isomerase [Polyangiaceae bacterium]